MFCEDVSMHTRARSKRGRVLSSTAFIVPFPSIYTCDIRVRLIICADRNLILCVHVLLKGDVLADSA